jgi:hypothetical protein
MRMSVEVLQFPLAIIRFLEQNKKGGKHSQVRNQDKRLLGDKEERRHER